MGANLRKWIPLDTYFYRQKVIFWPLRLLPLLDINLIIKYIYKK